MAKPALYWAVRYDMGRYEVLKITTEREHQVSGIRGGMIGAITVNRNTIVGKFTEERHANLAISNIHLATTDLDREISIVDRQLQDLRTKRKNAIKDHFKSAHGAVH